MKRIVAILRRWFQAEPRTITKTITNYVPVWKVHCLECRKGVLPDTAKYFWCPVGAQNWSWTYGPYCSDCWKILNPKNLRDV